MHLLVINGSPRGTSSNTDRLLRPFMEGAEAEGATVKRLYTNQLQISDCQGCFACWGKTPGECFLEDDMSMVLSEMGKADVVIWASPLYTFGITSSLKRILDRMLPLASPEICQDEQGCYHPPRFPGRSMRSLWVLNSGFPDIGHFDAVHAHMDAIDKARRSKEPSQRIFCTAGELLKHEGAKPLWGPYLELIRQCGRELVIGGRISEETLQKTRSPFIKVDAYMKYTNQSWKKDE